jgi:hypothetical protein
VSRFLATAADLLDAAVAARQNNAVAAGVTVLVDHGGGLTLVTDSDWPLESLARERGAREAYRVHERANRLFVEGRAGANACLLSAASPDEAARALRHFASPVALGPVLLLPPA